MYEKYNVEIKFRDKIAGGTPKHPDVIKSWIDVKLKDKLTATEKKKLAKETIQAMSAEEEISKSWNGFKQDSEGVHIEDRHVKALIREAAYVLELTRGKGSVIKKQIIQHGLFIKPAHIHLTKSGKTLMKPDGYEEKAIHIMTALGPRDALKRYDYVEKADASFQIWIAKPYSGGRARITEKEIRAMFDLGQEIGLGADRSQQMGKFDIIKLEKLKDN